MNLDQFSKWIYFLWKRISIERFNFFWKIIQFCPFLMLYRTIGLTLKFFQFSQCALAMTGRGVEHNGYIETGRIRQAYGENGDSRHNAIIYNQYLMYINFFKLKKIQWTNICSKGLECFWTWFQTMLVQFRSLWPKYIHSLYFPVLKDDIYFIFILTIFFEEGGNLGMV